MSADLYAQLAQRLGPKGHSTDPATIAPYLFEWRGRLQGATPFLAMPSSTEETRDVVQLCAKAGVAITPQGGNTGLVGGQVPAGEVLLSLKRMSKVRSIDVDNDSLVAEAGVVLTAVQHAANESNRLFPLSLASEGSATVGGLISTNAGGVHVLRYGMMRDLVLGLEVVLADGRVLNGLKALRKDNTGYDLKQLFIGAEGTLGVITAASLKLFPRPRAHETAMLSVRSPRHALSLLTHLKTTTGAVAAFEVMNRIGVDLTVKNVANARDPLPGADWLALVEFEAMDPRALRESVEAALSSAIDSDFADNALIAENTTQTRDFWVLRESMSAGHRPEGMQVASDISVPVSRIPDFLSKAGAAAQKVLPDVRMVAFGHMGDGNIHYSVLAPVGMAAETFPYAAINDAVNETAVGLGGSISAEHGIGVVRLDDFARFKDAESVSLMRALKRALDPNNVMNPRVLIA